jgi:hypothetical protein
MASTVFVAREANKTAATIPAPMPIRCGDAIISAVPQERLEAAPAVRLNRVPQAGRITQPASPVNISHAARRVQWIAYFNT